MNNCLQQQLFNHKQQIEAWLEQHFSRFPAILYGSVDLRNADFKLAPVDMNIFPAGFNNLSKQAVENGVLAMKQFLTKYNPEITDILLIPENHTRNMFYLESLKVLQEIILAAGYRIKIGSLIEDLTEETAIKLPSGKSIVLSPVKKINNNMQTENFIPQLIILNNDLSTGTPEIFNDITQPIIPLPNLGWHSRLKSRHFNFYQTLTEEFALAMDIDSWLINPYFATCNNINFLKHEGEDCLTYQAQKLIEKIKVKYQQYKISEEVFLIIKADAGTYGMGIMTLNDINQLKQLNHRQRTHMAATKGSVKVTSVLLQEGVYTVEKDSANNAIAEPVIYMMNNQVIGGFYRVHPDRKTNENLNAKGMYFQPMEMDIEDAQWYSYTVIARLSMLAANMEMQELVV